MQSACLSRSSCHCRRIGVSCPVRRGRYLKRVPGVIGGVVFLGQEIGMAGGLELAA